MASMSSNLQQTRADSYRTRPKNCTYLTPTPVLSQPFSFGSYVFSRFEIILLSHKEFVYPSRPT